MKADMAEPYTRTTPFQEKQDPSVECVNPLIYLSPLPSRAGLCVCSRMPKVLLQTPDALGSRCGSRRPCIRRHDPGRAQRGTRQTPRVRLFRFAPPFPPTFSCFIFASFSFCSSGAYAMIASFLTFSMIQFRDGPFIRPHPAFWRVVLGINLLYELTMVFLLFQDLESARRMMALVDPSLGVPSYGRNHATACEFTPKNVLVSIRLLKNIS